MPLTLKLVAAASLVLVGVTVGVLTVGAMLATVTGVAALVPVPPSLSVTDTVTLYVALWA